MVYFAINHLDAAGGVHGDRFAQRLPSTTDLRFQVISAGADW